MKKCLACDNTIEELDHYVCSDCYSKVKTIKKDLIQMENLELKSEYDRWKRNMTLARDQKYKNDYQLRMIALAEMLRDKYHQSKAINSIIDYSNNQKPNNTVNIKISERELEDEFEKENYQGKEDPSHYQFRHKCKDGHRVISKSELIIDDFLTDKEIRHSYDREIDDNTDYRYDFKLLDYDNVYIEHWGYKEKKNYEIRRTLKTQYYKSKGYTLIDSDEDSIIDINNLKKELRSKIPTIFEKK